MKLRSVLLGGTACLLAVASWVAVASSASNGPTDSRPKVAGWSAWPFETTCNRYSAIPFDPIEAFSSPPGVERGSAPAELALAALLADPPHRWIGGRGWRRLVETEDQAVFARGDLDGQSPWLAFELREGVWTRAESGKACVPTSVAGRGVVVDWSVARKQPRIGPRTRTLWVDLGPGGCASGAPQNPRAHFVFRAVSRRLLMVAWLENLTGGGTCQGLIEPPRKVRLPFPLGGYRLFDGGTFPPLPAGKTRERHYPWVASRSAFLRQ